MLFRSETRGIQERQVLEDLEILDLVVAAVVVEEEVIQTIIMVLPETQELVAAAVVLDIWEILEDRVVQVILVVQMLGPLVIQETLEQLLLL